MSGSPATDDEPPVSHVTEVRGGGMVVSVWSCLQLLFVLPRELLKPV